MTLEQYGLIWGALLDAKIASSVQAKLTQFDCVREDAERKLARAEAAMAALELIPLTREVA